MEKSRLYVVLVAFVIICVTVLMNQEAEKRDDKEGRHFSIGLLRAFANSLSAFAGTILVAGLLPNQVHELFRTVGVQGVQIV